MKQKFGHCIVFNHILTLMWLVPRMLVPGLFLGLAVALTWPLAAQMHTALNGWGDPQLNTWIIAWNAHALRSNPLAVWDAPIFYPYPDTLAYTDHHLMLSALVAPLIWLTGNAVLAYNLLLLLSFALSGWAVYCLAYDTTRQHWPALIAGAAFAFCNFRMAHLLHIQVLQTAWLPWALLFLRRLLFPPEGEQPRWRSALLFGLFAALQALTAIYYAFFALLVLGLYVLFWATVTGWRVLRRHTALPWGTLGKLLTGGGLAMLLVLPFMLPYLRVYQTLGIVRSPRELDNWSAPLHSYLSVEPSSMLYRLTGLPLTDTGEMVLFPGLLILLLAGVALWNSSGIDKYFWLLLALVAALLSFGTGIRLERGGEPLPIPTIYTLLYNYLPGFGALRVPARWGMLVTLALAMLAALALAGMLARLGMHHRSMIGGVLLALVLLESLHVPLTLTDPTRLHNPPPVYSWLGAPQQRDVAVVLELPVGRTPRGEELARITWRQFYSQQHWKGLPVAFSGLIPFGTTDLLAMVQHFPAPDVLTYLQLVGIDTLVLHRNEYDLSHWQQVRAELDASPLVVRRAEVGDALVYTLRPAAPLPDTSDLSAPVSVYVSNDERMPGLPTLALVTRWRERGLTLYGSKRTRYYAPLRSPAPGQVFDFGLLAEQENPRLYGFNAANRLWSAHGLALYRRDPALRASLDLGTVKAGNFHPHYPAVLDLRVEAQQMQVGKTMVSWKAPLEQAYIEIDAASLYGQPLTINGQRYPPAAGARTVTTTVTLDQLVRISGSSADTALQHIRVWASMPPNAVDTTPTAVISATASLSGSRLEVRAQAAELPALLLDIQGAAAYDDQPVYLLSGVQDVPPNAQLLTYQVDLLAPAAPWLAESVAPVEGRYIAYLKDATRPSEPGRPVAQFVIRGGRVEAFQAVELPLTTLR